MLPSDYGGENAYLVIYMVKWVSGVGRVSCCEVVEAKPGFADSHSDKVLDLFLRLLSCHVMKEHSSHMSLMGITMFSFIVCQTQKSKTAPVPASSSPPAFSHSTKLLAAALSLSEAG